MAGNRKSGGSNVALTTRKRRSGGALVTITTAKRRVAGAWVDLFPTASSAATSNQTIVGGTVSPNDASALYEINTDGKVYQSVNAVPPSVVETWLLSGLSSDFEAMATVTSGTLTSGSNGVWTSLGSGALAWTKVRTLNTEGSDTCVFTLSIRRVSDSVVVDTSTITLTAEVAI